MSKSAEKNILVIFRSPPYGSHAAQEALDVALTAAAFGQKTSVLFMDDGVSMILKNQDSSGIQLKNIQSQTEAFTIYDIEQQYVCAESMAKRNLQLNDLLDGAHELNAEGLKELIDLQDAVLCF